MKKRGKFLLAGLLATAMIVYSSTNVFAKNSNPQVPSYQTVTEIYDWGAAVSKIIIDLGQNVEQNSVTRDTFKVHVARKETRENTKLLGEEEGDRTITKAYVADKDGNSALQGQYVVLEMEVGPTVSLASPLNFSVVTMQNDWITCNYTISQQQDIRTSLGSISGLVVTTYTGDNRKLVDDFTTGKASYDNVTLTYASYTPTIDKKKQPLLIWLHGMGEGGTDPTIPIAGNKASAFATKEMQAYFAGAYVLVPQTPTFWMDGFTGFGDGTSKYEKALMALIKEYVANHQGIDTNRIYIGGDSNGGYMTMLLIRDYPEYFAAAFPTCEALKDALLTEADIQKMKNVPIWFTAAKTDKTVPPAAYVLPTYDRLIKAGAPNVHLSLFENVLDTTGLYKKANGAPYEYDGHWSWIYVYNNQCSAIINGKETSIMKWLSTQALTGWR